jgi:hypothetical protein
LGAVVDHFQFQRRERVLQTRADEHYARRRHGSTLRNGLTSTLR